MIKTKDFILRHPMKKDLNEYYETETDSLSKKMFNSFPVNLNEAKLDLEKHIKDNRKKLIVSETFSIVVKSRYAGYVKIQSQNFDVKSCEGRIHIAIHPDFRGKGLAKKVIEVITNYGFKKKKFKKIFAQCKFINKPLMNIIEKRGFKLEKIHNSGGVKKVLWVLEREES